MEQMMEFAIRTELSLPYDETLEKVTAALKSEGFGVITEIDVRETMKKKLDKDFRNYKILGACNPSYAYQTLDIDLDVGLLLPCNVIVYEADDGKSRVAAINPAAALKVIGSSRLEELAAEVTAKLEKVINQLATTS